jgi:ABC-type phosphate/phosphonate transport system substrate-binding protein
MKRIAGPIAFLAVAAGCLLALTGSPAGGGEAEARVKIGLVDSITRGVPAMWTQIAMKPFKALMEEETGLTSEVVNGGDPLALGKSLDEDKIQVAVFHGHEFAWARQRYPKIKAIAVCVNNTRSIKVHLVVRSDSAAASYADLKGTKISVPRLGRAPCQVFLERRCVKPGVAPEKFYAAVDHPFGCVEALEELIEGETNAVVVDGQSLDDYRKSNPDVGKRLRSIAESEPFPCGVIAYRPGRFSESKVSKFRDGLVNAKSSSRGRDTLKMLRLTAFEAPPANHDALLAAIAKVYPLAVPAK